MIAHSACHINNAPPLLKLFIISTFEFVLCFNILYPDSVCSFPALSVFYIALICNVQAHSHLALPNKAAHRHTKYTHAARWDIPALSAKAAAALLFIQRTGPVPFIRYQHENRRASLACLASTVSASDHSHSVRFPPAQPALSLSLSLCCLSGWQAELQTNSSGDALTFWNTSHYGSVCCLDICPQNVKVP